MTMDGVDLNAAANKVAHSLALPSVAGTKHAASPMTATGPMAAGQTGSTTGSADDGTQITSSDFLTLLVTEMQNQDPTQPTDPNAYIQQLVGVNSLQQLIAINQDLTDLGTSASASGSKSGLTPTSAI